MKCSNCGQTGEGITCAACGAPMVDDTTTPAAAQPATEAATAASEVPQTTPLPADTGALPQVPAGTLPQQPAVGEAPQPPYMVPQQQSYPQQAAPVQQPAYGAQQQPVYGTQQPIYGTPQQPAYGAQQPYGVQQPYGAQQPYGYPTPQQPKKKKTGLILGIAAGALVLILLAVFLFVPGIIGGGNVTTDSFVSVMRDHDYSLSYGSSSDLSDWEDNLLGHDAPSGAQIVEAVAAHSYSEDIEEYFYVFEFNNAEAALAGFDSFAGEANSYYDNSLMRESTTHVYCDVGYTYDATMLISVSGKYVFVANLEYYSDISSSSYSLQTENFVSVLKDLGFNSTVQGYFSDIPRP